MDRRKRLIELLSWYFKNYGSLLCTVQRPDKQKKTFDFIVLYFKNYDFVSVCTVQRSDGQTEMFNQLYSI